MLRTWERGERAYLSEIYFITLVILDSGFTVYWLASLFCLLLTAIWFISCTGVGELNAMLVHTPTHADSTMTLNGPVEALWITVGRIATEQVAIESTTNWESVWKGGQKWTFHCKNYNCAIEHWIVCVCSLTCNAWSIRLLEASTPFSRTHRTVLVGIASVDERFDALLVLRRQTEKRRENMVENLQWKFSSSSSLCQPSLDRVPSRTALAVTNIHRCCCPDVRTSTLPQAYTMQESELLPWIQLEARNRNEKWKLWIVANIKILNEKNKTKKVKTPAWTAEKTSHKLTFSPLAHSARDCFSSCSRVAFDTMAKGRSRWTATKKETGRESVSCRHSAGFLVFCFRKKPFINEPFDFLTCWRRFLLSAIMTENQSNNRLPIAVSCCCLHSADFNPANKTSKKQITVSERMNWSKIAHNFPVRWYIIFRYVASERESKSIWIWFLIADIWSPFDNDFMRFYIEILPARQPGKCRCTSSPIFSAIKRRQQCVVLYNIVRQLLTLIMEISLIPLSLHACWLVRGELNTVCRREYGGREKLR